MEKEDILKKIEDCFYPCKNNKSRNSMGVSESFYNSYYLIGMCFTDNKKISIKESILSKLSEKELNNLMKLADYASDVFY